MPRRFEVVAEERAIVANRVIRATRSAVEQLAEQRLLRWGEGWEGYTEKTFGGRLRRELWIDHTHVVLELIGVSTQPCIRIRVLGLRSHFQARSNKFGDLNPVTAARLGSCIITYAETLRRQQVKLLDDTVRRREVTDTLVTYGYKVRPALGRWPVSFPTDRTFPPGNEVYLLPDGSLSVQMVLPPTDLTKYLLVLETLDDCFAPSAAPGSSDDTAVIGIASLASGTVAQAEEPPRPED